MSTRQPPVTQTERILAEIWCDVLELDEVGVLDNFFEVGGYSMLMQLVRERIAQRIGTRPTLAELFIHSTIRSCAAFLDGSTQEQEPATISQERVESSDSVDSGVGQRDTDIAVIGLACRFPDAVDVDQFWGNLVSGVDSVSRFFPKSIAGPGGSTR